MPDAVSHTPAPWTASERYSDAASVLDANGFPVADCEPLPILEGWSEKFPHLRHWADADGSVDEQTSIERPIEELRANAHLIAAAPDLLAACRAAAVYDNAISRRAADGRFELAPRGAIAEGVDLDALYYDWQEKARVAVAKAEGRA